MKERVLKEIFAFDGERTHRVVDTYDTYEEAEREADELYNRHVDVCDGDNVFA